MENAHTKTVKEILDHYQVDPEKGFSDEQAKKSLEIHGLNELQEKNKISPITIFFLQFKSFIVYILIFAVAISFIAKEYIDASLILGILVLNAFLGFIQEYKAEKAIEELRKLSSLKAKVMRSGQIKMIDTKELVPGDIILVEEGSKIPADARIIETINLETMEAALTGESDPSSKIESVLNRELAIGERKNIIFASTVVTKGRAKAIIVSTGMNTEIGKIAGMISTLQKEETPLQKKLESLGKKMGVATIFIAIVIFFLGIYRDNIYPSLLSGDLVGFLFQSKIWLITSVALAIAAVPEGLPAIVTITLAIGTKRMLKKNALIRKLPSVETLGDTTVICSDKTGTITKNEMFVRKVYVNNSEKEMSEFSRHDLFLFNVGVLCNNSSLEKNGKELIGDPTEIALLFSAEKAGVKIEELKEWKRIKENSFDSMRKMMSTVSIEPKSDKKFVFAKGAPEILLEKCDRILINGKTKPLNSKEKKNILSINERFADGALRVLGFAYKEFKKTEEDERHLIFVGLQGMIDPPRDEVKESIQKCKEAGIKIIMLTGDNLHTAKAIAREVGIEGDSMKGADFAILTKEEQLRVLEKTNIFARVDPGHKLLIVELLQKNGEIVAMTGDGVNDAPAIKKADIGIAMGIRGTDVTKETSEMILLDDNFSTIVNAIEEGRGIRANISKFVNYLVSSNLAEVMIIAAAIFLTLPLPMTAVMLLWLNLITDGLPALALGLDKNSNQIMKRSPTKVDNIVGKDAMIKLFSIAALITVAVLGLFYWATREYSYLEGNLFLSKIQTIAFTTVILMELVRLQAIRSQYKLGIFSNKYLVFAVLASIVLQIAVIYTPLSSFFGTTFLNVKDWIFIVGTTFLIFIINIFVIKLHDKKSKAA